MAMLNEQLQKLLGWYVRSSNIRKNWEAVRRNALEENHKWIQPGVIKQMPDDELTEKFLEYYRTGARRQNLNQIYRDRIIRDKKRFREALLYLLNETIDLATRINNILEGEYHIRGFGKAITTSFLMDYDPAKYCLWNNKTMMGFSALGFKKPYAEKEPWGTCYLKVLQKLTELRDLVPEFNLTFIDIDLFLHIIAAEDEGIEAIKAISEGHDIMIVAEGKETYAPSSETMEFAMEKYLEEFIEANFGRIDFGARLELYQDEESSGRQYPTPIGNIDLLAVDNETKDFVIIELKKGRSSDFVVGQILRYMGWVKENLAGDHNVRGIIVTKEKDERLDYALKFMPNVTVFLYNVHFDLKKFS